MAKAIELLLLESVDHLGIVGDVVKVRAGYARNYLLPRGLADAPNQELISSLAEKRAEAQREVAQRRKQREEMIERLDGFTLEVEKNANELGLLYGSVTQHEIAELLGGHGFVVRDRDVRLSHTIKRVDTYEVVIRPESDLEATITLIVHGAGQEYLEALEEAKLAEQAEAAEGDRGTPGEGEGEGEAAPAEGDAPADAEAAKPAGAEG